MAVIPSVAICWLIPRLADFRSRWPGVEIRILYALHGKDIDFGSVDVAVIYSEGAPQLAGMATTCLLPGDSIPVCSPGVAAAASAIATPQGMVAAGLLHDTDESGWRGWLAAAGVHPDSASGGPVFEDFNLLRAALAGQGVAICPLAIIRDDLAQGRLVQLSDRAIRSGWAYYIIRREAPESIIARSQAAFCDWLLGTVAAGTPS